MSHSIIEVTNLSKSYTISHEGRESYTSLRDVIARKTKKIFSFPKSLTTSSSSKEEFWALKDINFNIEPGDRVGIIGRNGAGKSTLLKILSRITEPTTGQIKIKGRVASLLEVGTGFHPELTGRENVYLNGAILGMSRAEIKKHFDAIVDFSGVEKFLDTPVKRYSSGMYVRLAFAVAAHLEPEILIVDEVLAVGDAEFQKKCLGKMEDVSKNEGRTVLFVSHNMGTVLKLCSNSILLNTGKIEAIGTSAEIVEKYYDNKSDAIYKKEQSDKAIFIQEAITCNAAGETQLNFSHKQEIHLRITIGVNKYNTLQNIGICLLRQDKKRVFTVNKLLSSFYKEGSKKIIVDFILEGGLIAPMDYSFLIALNTPTGLITYDYQEDICPIKIYDGGTNLSFAEGYDYGCIILKDKWSLINS